MPTITRYFVNRTGAINQLNTALHSEGSEKDSCVLVYGQTGIGKTQLLAKYMRDCKYNEIRTSHVDLEDVVTKGYLGLIEAIMEGLGNEGFEDLDATFDEILLKFQLELGRIPLGSAVGVPATAAPVQAGGMVFQGPVTAQNQTFVSGDVTYHNAKIENIYHFHLAESEQMEALIRGKVTRAFRSCLQSIARQQLVVILLDHWDKTSDPLRQWLKDHLLNWATDLTLKKALVVVSRESLPLELEQQLGLLPLAVPPFRREDALEFWLKNGLPEQEFLDIGEEIYSIPAILALEVGKRRFRQAIK
jgi:Cdc6-like AAA superfamily ATPase